MSQRHQGTIVTVLICEMYTGRAERIVQAKHTEAGRDFGEDWRLASIGLKAYTERAILMKLRRAGWRISRVPAIAVEL